KITAPNAVGRPLFETRTSLDARIGEFSVRRHMRTHLLVASALAALVASGCNSTTASRGKEPHRDPILRREILAMVQAHQRVRDGITLPMTPTDVARMQEVDARHAARMKQILATHGWPGRSLVGEDGAHAAWLLVQHSDDQFMADSLPLMEQAVRKGEAARR